MSPEKIREKIFRYSEEEFRKKTEYFFRNDARKIKFGSAAVLESESETSVRESVVRALGNCSPNKREVVFGLVSRFLDGDSKNGYVNLPGTPFMSACCRLLAKLDERIPSDFRGVLRSYWVGGAASHVYTCNRVSTDLGAKFVPPVSWVQDFVILYDNDGSEEAVRLDRSYFPELGVMHPDWEEGALDCGMVGRIKIMVISPLDLAVSKIGRYSENDERDIRSMARGGLLDAESLEARYRDALDYYVGNPKPMEHNLLDALRAVREECLGGKEDV